MPVPRRVLAAALGVLALLAAGACGDSPSDPDVPPGPPGLRIVAGEGLTDTVQAALSQALVVEVRDGHDAPLGGIVVRFESTGALVSRDTQPDYRPQIVDTTDERGRARARVQLGQRAGPARVVVSLPETGAADTAQFTVAPGAVARVVALPADTALLPGRSYTLSTALTDRFGHLRQDTPTYTAGAPGVSVSGGVVTTQSVARSWVIVQAGGRADTSYVSVVPEGTLVATTAGSGLATFRTDGSELTALVSAAGGAVVTDWSPDGTEVVFDAGIVETRVVNVASRAVRALGMFTRHGRFSPDGGTIYYATLQWGLRRQARDGSNDELVPMSERYDRYPSPSPDGTRLAYVATPILDGPGELRVVTLASGVSTSLNIAGDAPSWSPLGERIAFVDDHTGALKLVSADGTGVRALTSSGRYSRGIGWSPDGRWLAASNSVTGRIDLVDTESSVVLPLPFASGWTGASWKP